MSDDAPLAPAALLPTRRGGKLTFMLLVLNLAGSGFIGLEVMKLRHATAAETQAVSEAEAAAAGPRAGPVVALDAFVVNLNEPGSSRYLKASFELELVNDAAADELRRSTRAVRDDVLRYLSNLSVADTLGEVNKDKIQAEMVSRIEKTLGAKQVTRLYFTEFVVQ